MMERAKLSYDRQKAAFSHLDPQAISTLSQLCGDDITAVQCTIHVFSDKCNSALEPLRTHRRRRPFLRESVTCVTFAALLIPIACVQLRLLLYRSSAILTVHYYYAAGPILAAIMFILTTLCLRCTARQEGDFEAVLRSIAVACMADSPVLARHGVMLSVEVQRQGLQATEYSLPPGTKSASSATVDLVVSWKASGGVRVLVS